MLFLILVLILTTATRLCWGDSLKPRCGDCWCITYGEELDTGSGSNESCPDATGISDTFPERLAVYDTFELINPDAPYLQLRTSEGGECYPFADTLGEVEGYAKSILPQCAIPGLFTNQTSSLPLSETMVCAYKFEQGVECSGRKYEILNYDSAQTAENDGAVVTHTGACGVCSNAKDLWARMRTIDTFDTETLICATLYIVQPDSDDEKFDSLVQCAIKAGLSPECALLFAHLGAATVGSCRDDCESNTATGSTQTNGPPPTCSITPCLECTRSWNMYFDDMAGRSMERSGITENTAKRCSVFSRIVHDPCLGASNTLDQVTPTTTTTGTSSNEETGTGSNAASSTTTTWVVLLAIGVAADLPSLLPRIIYQ